MTADQLGDNRPQLPKSDDELTQHFRSLAQTIRTSFNDHLHILVPLSDSSHLPSLGRQQLISVPPLENMITLFELEKEARWQLEEAVQRYSHNNGISGNKQRFKGFDEKNGMVFDGELALDSRLDSHTMAGLSIEEDHKRIYGTWLRTNINRYSHSPEGSERTFGLHYDGPLDIGQRHPGKFLSYCDEREGLLIYYQAPSFEVQDSHLNHNFIQESYRDAQGFIWDNQDQDVLDLIKQEENETDNVYNRLRAALASDEIRWDGQPKEATMIKITELARFLESKYRCKKGIIEFTYKEYAYRITAFQDYIWLSLGQYGKFDPKSPYNSDGTWYLKKAPKKQDETTKWKFRGLLDIPECPYPDMVYPGNLCLARCTLRLCPRGLGPFDPGPHNPSAPNDPRGRDPRGLIDPRGPR